AAAPPGPVARGGGGGAANTARLGLVRVRPVAGGAGVPPPRRGVGGAGDVSPRSARLEQEHGGVAAVHQATCDHATRRPGTHDHVVVTSGEHLATPGFMILIDAAHEGTVRGALWRVLPVFAAFSRFLRTCGIVSA